MFNARRCSGYGSLGLVLLACLTSVRAAPPPPPQGAAVQVLSCVYGGFSCPGFAYVDAPGASYVGEVGGFFGGKSPVSLKVGAGPEGFSSDLQIFPGSGENLGVATGAKLTDWIYVDDPSGRDFALVPLTYVLSLGGHFTVTGGNFAGATDTLSATLGGATVGAVQQSWSASQGPGPARVVFHTQINNRQWQQVGFGADLRMRANLSNVDELVLGGGMQILVGNVNALDLSLNGASGAVLYSLSGHDYALAPVPEPGTWALLLSGIAVTGWYARRVRRESARMNPSR